jgi:hypothetical protein
MKSLLARLTPLLLLVVFATGCPQKVAPHQPGPADTYCVYTVKAVRGGGAIPVGGTVCLYCPPPVKNTCPGKITIKPAEGVEYDLTTTGRTCVSCPAGGQTYEKK